MVDDHEAALCAFALDFSALEPVPAAPGFLAYLKEAAVSSGVHGGEEGVDLLTFHRAKGLEWESVWLIGLEDGYVPLAHAVTEAQLAEERRLLYVALTRARETLACSWAEARTMAGRTVDRSRSPLLDPIARVARDSAVRASDPLHAARSRPRREPSRARPQPAAVAAPGTAAAGPAARIEALGSPPVAGFAPIVTSR